MQIDQVERDRPLAEDVLDREIIGVVEALDAAALQIGRVGIDLGHVVAGDEGHLVAEALHRQDVLEGGVRAGVLVGLRHRIVDHQRALAHAPLGLELGHLTVKAMAGERVPPAIEEFAVVDRLEALHAAAGDTGAGAGALEMDDLGGRLHHRAIAA